MSRDFIPGRFRDQVALVVGGAQGIGKAIAVRLVREGARVVIADIDRPMMARTVGELSSEGARARQVLCDVRRPRQVNRMVEQVVGWHGRIDVLMYIAGVGKTVDQQLGRGSGTGALQRLQGGPFPSCQDAGARARSLRHQLERRRPRSDSHPPDRADA